MAISATAVVLAAVTNAERDRSRCRSSWATVTNSRAGVATVKHVLARTGRALGPRAPLRPRNQPTPVIAAIVPSAMVTAPTLLPLRSARSRRGPADHELGAQLRGRFDVARAREQGVEMVDGGSPGLLPRDPYGRQGGRDHGVEGNVVETDDAQLRGNGYAVCREPADQPDRHARGVEVVSGGVLPLDVGVARHGTGHVSDPPVPQRPQVGHGLTDATGIVDGDGGYAGHATVDQDDGAQALRLAQLELAHPR